MVYSNHDLFRSSICKPGFPERIRFHPFMTPTPYDQCRANVMSGAAKIVEKDLDGEVPKRAPAQQIAIYAQIKPSEPWNRTLDKFHDPSIVNQRDASAPPPKAPAISAQIPITDRNGKSPTAKCDHAFISGWMLLARILTIP